MQLGRRSGCSTSRRRKTCRRYRRRPGCARRGYPDNEWRWDVPALRRRWRVAAAKNGNARPAVPSVVVPSGKTARHSPRCSSSTSCTLMRAAERALPRSMNRVCARAHNQPMTGQRRTSDLATKRIGTTAFSTNTSSHEMWLVTMRPWRKLCSGSSSADLDADVEDIQQSGRPVLQDASPYRQSEPRIGDRQRQAVADMQREACGAEQGDQSSGQDALPDSSLLTARRTRKTCRNIPGSAEALREQHVANAVEAVLGDFLCCPWQTVSWDSPSLSGNGVACFDEQAVATDLLCHLLGVGHGGGNFVMRHELSRARPGLRRWTGW